MIKDKLKNFDQFFLDHLLLPLAMFFLIIVCILILSFTSHAASDSNNALPYVISSHNSLNSVVDYSAYDSMINSALNKIGSHSFTSGIQYNSILFVITDINSSGQVSYNFIFDPYYNVSLSDSQYDNFDVVQNSINLSYISGYWYRSTYNFSNSSQGSIYRNTGNFNVFGSPNTITSSYGTYTPNYPFLLKGSEDVVVNDLNDHVIISQNSQGPVIITGHATAPINDPNNIVNGLDGHRLTKPNFPTINNYSWTTYNNPPIDTSNAESLLESIWDSLVYNFSYLFSNLGGLFNNLTNNLENFVNYIVDSIYYISNNIVSAIQDFASDFYNNMVSLFEPLFDQISYITAPVDSTAINSALNNTSFVNIKSQFSTFFTTFESAFDISEPTTFTLTINIQNIRTFYNFGCRSPVIIYLDEHFTPIRTALRTFLWILISFGTVFIVERGLSDWLRGENDTK